MIQISEVAKRYAAALFNSVSEKNKAAEVLEELRSIEKNFDAESIVGKFFSAPLISGDEKEAALRVALEKSSITIEVKNLLLLLAKKNRLEEWSGVVNAFQAKTDEAHGVVRGIVRAAVALSPESRQKLESRVSQVTGKKVILEYKEDSTLLGGLVAEVGSLTFDDSLETQLKLMNEDLKRRAH